MSAPFERAKLAGYDVDFDRGEDGAQFAALAPNGEEIESRDGPMRFDTERAAWEACDAHRMFGDTDHPAPTAS